MKKLQVSQIGSELNNPLFSLDDLTRYNVLIESLPGIFYLYEKCGDDFLLKRWNKNHETLTGYTSDELRNKPVLEFFKKEEHQKIINGLQDIISKGEVKNIHAHLKLKNRTTIPFAFEGYRILINDRFFFLGTGIDISFYEREKKKVLSVESSLLKKERALLSYSVENEKYTNFIRHFISKIDQILEKDDPVNLKRELIKLRSEVLYNTTQIENWNAFRSHFNTIHPEFLEKLITRFPDLTRGELRYLSFLRINLTSNQIANLLNISNEGIKKKRYRIRKKLLLDRKHTLEQFIMTI